VRPREPGGNGGAIYAQNAVVVLNGVRLKNNRAQTGGAVSTYGGQMAILNSLFSQNQASDTGGALNINGTVLTFDEMTQFNNNLSVNRQGNSIFCTQGSIATNNCTTIDQVVTSDGTCSAEFIECNHAEILHFPSVLLNMASSLYRLP
jgi:predicted outer membrane repeat protein